MLEQYDWRKGSLAEQEHWRAYQKFVGCCRRLFLYGAGHGAARMLAFLQSYDMQADGVIVGDGQPHEDMLDGIPVWELSDVKIDAEDGILVTLKPSSQAEIVQELLRHGIRRDQILCQDLFFQPHKSTPDASRRLPDALKTGSYFEAQHILEDIGREEGTDKCSADHDYLKKYEFFLGKFRGQPMTLLELGVYRGDSIRMWCRYFPEAHVVGTDINQNCLKIGGGYLRNHPDRPFSRGESGGAESLPADRDRRRRFALLEPPDQGTVRAVGCPAAWRRLYSGRSGDEL